MHRALPPLALAFCAGAALRLAWHIPLPAILFVMAISGAAMLLGNAPRLCLACAAILAATTGALRTAAWVRTPDDGVARLAGRKWVRLIGAVDSDPALKPWGIVFDMEVSRAESLRGPEQATGRVRVTIPPSVPATPQYGARVSVVGRVKTPDDAANPGELSRAQYLRRDGVVAVMNAVSLGQSGLPAGNAFVAASLRARHHLDRGIRATLPPTEAALLSALLFSDTGALPEDVQQDFARAGTVHILSTSGLHVALLAGLLSILIPARRPRAKRWRAVLLVAMLVFFALMTGLRPAVMRAVVMIGAVLAAPLFNREPDTWCAIALAALCLVAASPGNLLDPGFQLSFSAVVFLAMWFDRRRPVKAPRWKRWTLDSVQTSVVASVATAPLAVKYFGSLSVASPISNLLVVPLLAPVMGLGLLQGSLWPHFPGLARMVGWLNRPLLHGMLWVTEKIGGFAWSAFDTGVISALWAGALLLALFGVFAAWRKWPETGILAGQRTAAAWGTAATVTLGALGWAAFGPPPPLRVTFLDVGQGDCALIQTPGGRNVLVDAGGRYEGAQVFSSDTGRRIVLPALRRAGVRKLDVVVLTHPHEDHAGGLPDVFSSLPIGLWLDSGQAHAAPGYTNALKIARSKGIPYRLARAGTTVQLGDQIALNILAPADPLLAGTGDEINNNSVVCRLTYGGTSFLLCGDAETAEEDCLTYLGTALKSDVLKAGHHGSSSSSQSGFLRSVRPAWTVISCGRANRYGHPDPGTLRRLDEANSTVIRTDISRGIQFVSNGTTIAVSTSRWRLP